MINKKKWIFLLIGIICFAFVVFNVEQVVDTPSSSSPISTSPISTSSPQPAIDPHKKTSDLLKQMHITFADDFNTFSRYMKPDGSITCEANGAGVWQTVFHFCSRTIFSNYEAELYIDQYFLDYLQTKNKKLLQTTSPFSLTEGVLAIKAEPIEGIISKAVGPWAHYTSGLITTQFSFSQTYGYFESRIKIPKGKGLWPAFWLLPTNRDWPPEIDIMEAFGAKNDRGEGNPTQIHYGTHAVDKRESCGAWHDVGVDITDDFHTYGVLWEATGMTYYFDGVAYAQCKTNKDSHVPFYILVNLAVGSSNAWPSSPASTNVWPAYMHIDYVRAYQFN